MGAQAVVHVSFPGHWGSLIPGQQHTLYADIILVHQFETLVRFNDRGVLQPLAAASWRISRHWRTYEFEIDTSRKFSDGSSLKSSDFKTSWENALRLAAKATNHSLADVMYLVEGYDSFAQTGTLSGIEAPADNRLIVRFSKPFRLALDHFAGSHYSAVRSKPDGTSLGTGPYIIVPQEKDRLTLVPNSHFVETASNSVARTTIEIRVIPRPDDIQALISGKVDVVSGVSFTRIAECDEMPDRIQCLEGLESSHMILSLNGNPGRMLADRKLRLALQAVIAQAFQHDNSWKSALPQGFTPDHQVYLPVQLGRIDPYEVKELVSVGEEYIDELIKVTQKHPLKLMTMKAGSWHRDQLKAAGIQFEELPESFTDPNFFEIYYKTFEPDVVLFGFSIAHGDPDSLYHKLGRKGAILSGMTYRESVAELLEQGRNITAYEELNSHYQQVSRAVLKDVPFIHLGFNRKVQLYNPNTVGVGDDQIRRRTNDLSNFFKK